MKVTIAAIGRDKRSSATNDIFTSYLKRLPWDVKLVELEEKKTLPAKLLMEKEAEMLMNAASGADKIIALDENGKNISSE